MEKKTVISEVRVKPFALKPCPMCGSRQVYWTKKARRWNCKRCGFEWGKWALPKKEKGKR